MQVISSVHGAAVGGPAGRFGSSKRSRGRIVLLATPSLALITAAMTPEIIKVSPSTAVSFMAIGGP